MVVPAAGKANVFVHVIDLTKEEVGKRELNISQNAVNNMLAGLGIQFVKKVWNLLKTSYLLVLLQIALEAYMRFRAV